MRVLLLWALWAVQEFCTAGASGADWVVSGGFLQLARGVRQLEEWLACGGIAGVLARAEAE